MPSELRVADPPILEVNSPAEARAAVRRVLAERPDLIKLWWIPEAVVPLAEQTGWVRAAIEEAHRAGVRVAVHATQLEVARAAILAGADVLVHSVDDRRVDDGFVRLLKERDVVYVTTLGVNEGYREVFEQRFKPTDLERRLGDAEVLATLDDLADLSWTPNTSPRQPAGNHPIARRSDTSEKRCPQNPGSSAEAADPGPHRADHAQDGSSYIV